MTKTIDTLVEDVYKVVSEKGGWDKAANEYFKERVGATMWSRLTPPEEERKGSLRMSNIGKPCARQLWYSIHHDTEGEDLHPSAHLKFLYGDILEDLLLSLAVAAGHTVEGCQDTMEINGIKGHRDAVIDGVNVDVKSASSYSFKKFESNDLRENDGFGYIRQLSSYVYASKDDPLVTDKKGGAFFVIDKTLGKICLDYYDFTKELDEMEDFYEDRKDMASSTSPPPRGFEPEPEGKSGNEKLGFQCSYCPFKKLCYPDLRTFSGYRGPVFLTTVKREPRMTEIT